MKLLRIAFALPILSVAIACHTDARSHEFGSKPPASEPRADAPSGAPSPDPLAIAPATAADVSTPASGEIGPEPPPKTGAEPRADDGAETRAQKKRKGPDPYTVAFERARPWFQDVLESEDAARREAALASIRSALADADESQNLSGLIALGQLGDIEFDKASFRSAVTRHLDAQEPRTRRAAYFALLSTGAEPGDLDRAIRLAYDPSREVRAYASQLIASYCHDDFSGDAGSAILHLLATEDPRELREALRGLLGVRVPPDVEARILELSRSPERQIQQDALYFGVSVLVEKSEAVVDRLIEILRGPNVNDAGRALWGLGQQVPAALQSKVADALLALIDTRTSRRFRTEWLSLLGRYADAAQLSQLEAIAQSPRVDAALQAAVRRTIDEIRGRIGG